MASGRRGPPDLKGTLGTLLRTTLEQAGALRDAAFRQARSQSAWAGGVLLERQRREVLASLGELVYELAAAGELGDLEDFPELERAIADLEAIDREIAEGAERTWGEPEPAFGSGARGPRSRPRAGRAGRGEVRVWRPNVDEAAELNPDEPEQAPEGEGPPAEGQPAGGRRAPRREGRRAARSGGGGIAFVDDAAATEDDDADLQAYMHEDDVPDKGDAP